VRKKIIFLLIFVFAISNLQGGFFGFRPKKEITWQKDKSVMVYISEGEFLMGSPEGVGSAWEHPVHKVYLDGYYIDKFEVTNAQYAKFLNEYGKDTDEQGNKMIFEHEWGVRKVKGKWEPHSGYEDHPVIMVTWYGAAQYAKWAGKRLPTEAEWEKACRAGSTARFCFGDSESLLEEYAWYYNNANKKTHIAGAKKPNAYGIYDMHGNVWEWVSDWFSKDYHYKSPYENPQGPDTGTDKMFCGGSWMYIATHCRCSSREWFPAWAHFHNTGFRCALSKPKK